MIFSITFFENYSQFRHVAVFTLAAHSSQYSEDVVQDS
jgi:hypothetical protein